MSFLSVVPIFLFYLISLVGDGCALIAIALAATMGGRPVLWGASFAVFHALYAVVGVVAAKELTAYSETLGDLLVLGGAILLLRHFLRHRFHHATHSNCDCQEHAEDAVTLGTMISTAAALSFHALAAGAVIQELLGPLPVTTLVPLLWVSSALLGVFVATTVHFGEAERGIIVRVLDKTPGLFAALLTGVCCWTLYHALEHSLDLSGIWLSLYGVASIFGACALGYIVHERVIEADLRASPKV